MLGGVLGDNGYTKVIPHVALLANFCLVSLLSFTTDDNCIAVGKEYAVSERYLVI